MINSPPVSFAARAELEYPGGGLWPATGILSPACRFSRCASLCFLSLSAARLFSRSEKRLTANGRLNVAFDLPNPCRPPAEFLPITSRPTVTASLYRPGETGRLEDRTVCRSGRKNEWQAVRTIDGSSKKNYAHVAGDWRVVGRRSAGLERPIGRWSGQTGEAGYLCSSTLKRLNLISRPHWSVAFTSIILHFSSTSCIMCVNMLRRRVIYVGQNTELCGHRTRGGAR